MRGWYEFNRGVAEYLRGHNGIGPDQWAGQPLLLTTIGARSGRPHTTPLLYGRDGNRLVATASKGGEATHPAWYHNLHANPEATVEVDGLTQAVAALVSDSD